MASSAPYTLTGTAKFSGGDFSQVQSLAVLKQAVRVASVPIGNSSFSVSYTYLNQVITAGVNGALSLDGIAVIVGDRVLIKDEINFPTNNGVYTVTQTGDGSHPFILTRSSDFNSNRNIVEGCLVPVLYGTTNVNTLWEMNANNSSGASPFTLNTSSILFTQVAAPASASAITQIGSVGIIKQPCRLGTGLNPLPAYTYSAGVITATSNGALSVDSVAVKVNDRILVRGESAGLGTHNGIYVVTQTGDASHPYILTRASDFNSSTNIFEGCLVYVLYGNIDVQSVFFLNSAEAANGSSEPFVLDTSPINFQLQFTVFDNATVFGNGTRFGGTVDFKQTMLWNTGFYVQSDQGIQNTPGVPTTHNSVKSMPGWMYSGGPIFLGDGGGGGAIINIPAFTAGNAGAIIRLIVTTAILNDIQVTCQSAILRGLVIAGDATTVTNFNPIATASTSFNITTSASVGDFFDFQFDGSTMYLLGKVSNHLAVGNLA